MAKIREFQDKIWDYYRKNGRDLLWRRSITPYRIFISEVMLQQTQVSRVSVKFPQFLIRFPDFKALANSDTRVLLQTWQGMGYNRRALYLKESAKIIVETYKGILPSSPIVLDTLPGIGPATASSIFSFVYNKPTVFIETNIRRVFIHHFFRDKEDVDDKEIYPLVQKTLDKANPREWYWALMDYGAFLGKTIENPNKKSKHYHIQPSFEGSDRQVRGMIIKMLLIRALTEEKLFSQLNGDVKKIKKILQDLTKEQFIEYKNDKIILKK